MMTAYEKNSSLELAIEDNLILIEAQGPWDIQNLNFLHKQLIWAVKQVDQRNYGVLLTLKGEAITVEGGLEYHLNFILKSKTKAIALNLGHCTTPLLTENLFSNIYRAAGFNHSFFDNAFDAQRWLENELAASAIVTL
jgi:hypothetical protein